MKNIDLLFFDNNNYQPSDAGNINDFYISDMGLEHIKHLEAFFNPESYDIFINTISRPVTSAEKIKERQNILKDFIEFPGIAQKMKAICDEIQKNKCRSSENNAKRRLIEFQNILTKSMDISYELLSHLKHRDFCSSALKDLRSQLDCRENIERVKSRIDSFVKCCVNDNIVLNIEHGSGFKFRNAYVYSGSSANQKNSQSFIKENAVFKFLQNKIPKQNKQKEIINGFYYHSEYGFLPLEAQTEEVLGAAMPYATSVITDLNRHILSFCANLSKQLAFYIACIDIIKFMENKNIKTVYPEICAEEKKIKAKNLYDFGLLLPKDNININSDEIKFVTPNDFDDSGDAVYLISGANQGGKTTFIKSIGIAQLFAQAGLKVPAEEYKCPVFNNFFSHFPKDEDEDLNFGKLAEELTRIKKAMPIITGNALVLLNESFATTTETEGFEIASEILRAVFESKNPPKILFVTHNYQLLKKRHEVSKLLSRGTKIKSLIVSEGKTSTDRTYKIIEGEPQENIKTMDFFGNLTR